MRASAEAQPPRPAKSSDLAADVIQDAQRLVNLEIALAKQEVKDLGIANALAAGMVVSDGLLVVVSVLEAVPSLVVIVVRWRWQAAVAWVVIYALRPEISKYQSTSVLEGEAPGPKGSGASRPRLFPNSTRPIPSNVVNGEDEAREPRTLEGIVRTVALVIVATLGSAASRGRRTPRTTGLHAPPSLSTTEAPNAATYWPRAALAPVSRGRPYSARARRAATRPRSRSSDFLAMFPMMPGTLSIIGIRGQYTE